MATRAAVIAGLRLVVAQRCHTIQANAHAELSVATPVDTGFARTNWQTTLDAPAEGTVPLGAVADPMPEPTDADADRLRCVTNNTAYIRRLVTPLEATNALMAHAISNWNVARAVLTFDGERFEPPADRPWIRMSIRDLPTGTVTHGSRANRLAERRANLIAQVFYPLALADGQGKAVGLATEFRDLFEPAPITSAAGVVNIAGGATVRRVGVDAATWYQVNVDVPITYHETI